MDFYELVNSRRSIRQYKEDDIEEEVIKRIMKTARLAPSAANKQPLFYYVIRDKKMRQKLLPEKNHYNFTLAPVLVVVCSNPQNAWVRGVDNKNHSDIPNTHIINNQRQ